MKPIGGIIPIVAAAFDEAGRIHLEDFQRLIHHLTGTGAQGITLFGLATEFYKLTDNEKEAMMQIMLAETSASPNVAGIVSITHHSWEVAVQHARRAEEAGADALMLLPPYFLGPSPEAIWQHTRKVAEAVSIPIIVQYAPSQTGVKIAPELFVELEAACPHAKYVKVETQPPGRYASILHEKSQGKIETLVGYAGVQMPDVLARGSAGIQPGCSFTEIYTALYGMHRSEDHAGFCTLFDRLLPYITYWMQSVELIIKAEKEILHKRGILSSSYCRAPEYKLDQAELTMIDRFLEEFAAYLK